MCVSLSAGYNLTSSIPNDLFDNLTELISLSLGSNSITGSLPETLSVLTNLEILSLGNNRFTNSIPSSLSNLKKLRVLKLGRSDTSHLQFVPSNGYFISDDEVAALEAYANSNFEPDAESESALAAFPTRNDRLNGTLPPTLMDLPLLETLDIQRQAISGPLLSFDNFVTPQPQLKHLNLSGNDLTGTIPSSIANSPSLVTLRDRKSVV